MKQTVKQILQSKLDERDARDAREVEVYGWLRTRRGKGSFAFLVIGDGSCQASLQVVVDAETRCHPNLNMFSTGAAIRVRGILQASRGQQDIEVLAREATLIGACPQDYPLQKKGHTLDFLRQISHLRGRSNTFGAVFRIRHSAVHATHGFFHQQGFYCVHTPIMTPSDSEGAGELFAVADSEDFFGKPAYLAVSGQLQLESACLALQKVYTFSPTFRAENSNTTRHLAEFWMLEPEIAFADLTAIADLAVAYLRYVSKQVLRERADDLQFLQKHYEDLDIAVLEKMTALQCERITYTQAIEILQTAKRDFEFSPQWGNDLQTEHERFLAEEVFAGAVIVTDYPKSFKPFYMRTNDDGKTVACMDLLLPKIGELIGGSEREERYEVLQEHSKHLQDMDWYLDLRRFGGAPTAGWGMGFDRLVQYFTGMRNIRDTILSPRAPDLLQF